MDQPAALQKPTRLEQAQARLESAFRSLEYAVANAPGFATMENSSQLTLDLEQENAALKKRNETLSELNDRTVTRLDSVIVRLKSAAGDRG